MQLDIIYPAEEFEHDGSWWVHSFITVKTFVLKYGICSPVASRVFIKKTEQNSEIYFPLFMFNACPTNVTILLKIIFFFQF